MQVDYTRETKFASSYERSCLQDEPLRAKDVRPVRNREPQQMAFQGFSKLCTNCGVVWHGIRDFVLDPHLQVLGYQASFNAPDRGIILLNHACGTTLGVEAGSLRPLYQGPQHSQNLVGTAECCRLCLEAGRLEICEAECALAWVRKVLQYLRRHELPGDEVEAC